uniref:Uncharacterized protein n=1 Tax=Candidatus Kentrum sp. TUN TaxID=2126343 RepID=A0A450ZJA9_9GAMM|nr:MAG: hypothetical protein BECKTUN1418F_GA0071002_10305 [Candidatus Kentron sp. TUN]VFK55489.1 MAG: hypothetical protein BECKTUN1418E_GA0071001_10305 [Candidatus Kentron sp. TUN]
MTGKEEQQTVVFIESVIVLELLEGRSKRIFVGVIHPHDPLEARRFQGCRHLIQFLGHGVEVGPTTPPLVVADPDQQGVTLAVAEEFLSLLGPDDSPIGGSDG